MKIGLSAKKKEVDLKKSTSFIPWKVAFRNSKKYNLFIKIKISCSQKPLPLIGAAFAFLIFLPTIYYKLLTDFIP